VSPERIPGLLEGHKEGSYAGYLNQAGDKLTLVAENLPFATDAGRNGLVYVNVDGYPRAFTFRTTFAGGNTPSTGDPVRQPILRINAPSFATPGIPYPLGVEIDNSPAGSTAEFSVERVGEGAEGENRDSEVVTFSGDRRERLLFGVPGPRGALLFKPEVQDWSATVDVREVFGKRLLKLRLLDGEKAPILVLDSKQVGEWKDTKDIPRVKEVVVPVVLDGTKPEKIQFAELLPKKLERDTLLPVKASAQDPESGIKSAVFFVGKPTPDGKIPDNAVTAEGKLVDEKTGVWAADLPVPAGQPATFEISVRFTNNAGLSAIETVRIQLVDSNGKGTAGGAAGAGGKPGIIEGSVVEGDRAQPGVEVKLTDDKNNLRAATKTDAAGKYVFKDVPPGAYKVTAAKSAAKTKGEMPVSVNPDEKKTGVVIKLTR
jgi:hypothetical protein